MQLQSLRSVPLHLGPGSDIRRTLENLAVELNASGFVLGVVGNLSQAAFQCPGQAGPTILEGDLEIITLQGTLSPRGVHLHLSFSDGACQVWGGHLEPGTLVQKGADLLVGLLEPEAATLSPSALADASRSGGSRVADAGPAHASGPSAPVATAIDTPGSRPANGDNLPPRVEIAVMAGCPYCARALRMLRTLGIAYRVVPPSGAGSLPEVRIDGVVIGGYDALADLHGRGELETLRHA